MSGTPNFSVGNVKTKRSSAVAARGVVFVAITTFLTCPLVFASTPALIRAVVTVFKKGIVVTSGIVATTPFWPPLVKASIKVEYANWKVVVLINVFVGPVVTAPFVA